MIKHSDIKKVVLAGSGVMGISFAQIFARNQYDVTLYDISEKALERAGKEVLSGLETQAGQGMFAPSQIEEILGRIKTTTQKDCFEDADFVLEAIVEKMDIKHSFWSEISGLVREDAILATNTSGLSVTEIAEAVKKPSRFAGMHWVNPPHLVPLVEVIAGEQSSEETVNEIFALAEKIHQKPIRVYKDPAGFILNRLQYAVIREACYCVEQGFASLEDVDNVMKYGLGMRYACIGPFETMDLGNLGTFFNVSGYMMKSLCNDTGVPKMLERMHEEGKLGVISGAGFYDYSGEKAKAAVKRRDTMFLKLAKTLFDDAPCENGEDKA